MKKVHFIMIVVLSVILAGSVIYGGLHLYANRNIVPEGVTVGGHGIGGMKLDEAADRVRSDLQAMEAIPLVLIDQETRAPDVQMSLGEAGIVYNADHFMGALEGLQKGSLLQRVRVRASFPRSWNIEAERRPEVLEKRLNTEWEKARYGEPANAVRRIEADDTVKYIPEIPVYRIQWKSLRTRLDESLPADFSILDQTDDGGVELVLPLAVEEPDITLEKLKKEGIERRITLFSTKLRGSSAGRVFNVASAARAVDGMILEPEGVFDYGKVIAKAESQYGFRKAPVIVNGRLQPGIGGGICQVSSTVYNAALRAGLEIVERRNHSLPVSYLPKGQDATFASGYINFRFRNNTGKHLLLRTGVRNGVLTVKFFGTFPSNVSYRIESRTVETLSPSVSYVNSGLPGSGQQLIQEGKPGYVVDTFRTKLINGKPVERIRISRDTYSAQKRVIAIGSEFRGRTPNTDRQQPSRSPLIEDGVGKTDSD
ncbi:VanW family protein [Paenibacillus sp. P96]|uniref:VanW family protein n=1 Tax=Paenibacillus zeirhizosphaerae TaxID=2987519 RepID=A0ABT9FP17_9BACL|nr:VanW family protein [Paenibacillus sp. P96]MDP4096488.1 VanW family protein [Paenibacillus sp. P96]